MMEKHNRKYEPEDNRESPESRRQMLGFHEVNFEQRREPYKEGSSIKANYPRQNTNVPPDNRAPR